MSKRTSLSFMQAGLGLILLAALSGWPALAASIDVSAQSNVFGAGHAVAPNPGGGSGGILPPVINLTPGYEKIIIFSGVTGTVGSWGGDTGNGPDGYGASDVWTGILPYGGISGITVDCWVFFLAGVLLDGNEPVDPALPGYYYTEADTHFPDYTMGLSRVFYIGDGLTGVGSGSPQIFHIPASATRLFLGFADGYFHTGLPGFYEDNSGSVNVVYDVYGAAQIRKLTLTPATVKSGRKVKGQIELTSAAPSGGAIVFLTSGNAAAVPPASIMVPAGKKTAKFQITTTKVTTSQKATIRALSANTVSKNLRLTK